MIRRACLPLLLTLLAAPAVAGDDVATDLERCQLLMAQEKWEQGVAAYRALFTDHEGDPAVAAALPDIEDGLKRCMFRRWYPPPGPGRIFGGDVEYFGKGSRLLKLRLVRGRSTNRWMHLSAARWLLDIRFEDRLTLELPPDQIDETTLILFCYSVEERGGYLIDTYVRKYQRDVKILYERNVSVKRVGDGRITQLGYASAANLVGDPLVVRRSRSNIEVEWGKGLKKKVRDRTYEGGYLAFGGKAPPDVRVEGVVDETWLRQHQGELESQDFRRWCTDVWKPDEVIPAWARKGGATGEEHHLAALPSDAELEDPARVTELIEGAVDGDPKSAILLQVFAVTQSERTAAYLSGLALSCVGSQSGAEEQFSKVIAAEPEFAPSLAFRGLVRLHLRKIDEAAADFAAARKCAPEFPWSYFGQVLLAIYEGDFEAADAVLAAAEEAGATSLLLDEMRSVVHRARRGPLWTKRYAVETTHFSIASDHSRDLCREVAHDLEVALDAYENHFPGVTVPARKARVYVFSTREGYLGYAEDVNRDLRAAAGAYNPTLRELVLYLPDDRTAFLGTIRHEGFHRFVHEFVDDAPIWLDEGWAQYFASARERAGGGFEPGASDPESLEMLKANRSALPDPAAVFLMTREEFMANARLHYPVSWAIVHFLAETKDTKLRSVLDDYLAALREGWSAKEAYARVLEPMIDRIRDGFPAHLRALW